MKEHVTNRLQSFTFLLLAIVIIGHLLIVARTLLFPIIIAIFLWHILNTIANLIKNSYFIGKHLPHWICLIFAVAIVVIVIYKLTEIITNNVNDVIRTAPRYQDNLEVILNSL